MQLDGCILWQVLCPDKKWIGRRWGEALHTQPLFHHWDLCVAQSRELSVRSPHAALTYLSQWFRSLSQRCLCRSRGPAPSPSDQTRASERGGKQRLEVLLNNVLLTQSAQADTLPIYWQGQYICTVRVIWWWLLPCDVLQCLIGDKSIIYVLFSSWANYPCLKSKRVCVNGTFTSFHTGFTSLSIDFVFFFSSENEITLCENWFWHFTLLKTNTTSQISRYTWDMTS